VLHEYGRNPNCPNVGQYLELGTDWFYAGDTGARRRVQDIKSWDDVNNLLRWEFWLKKFDIIMAVDPGLKKGEILLPPSITGKSTLLQYAKQIAPDGVQRADKVYVTTDVTSAELFAAVYPHGDVYKVRPHDMEEDPDCTEHGLSFQCSKAEVIAVICTGCGGKFA
jgi:hypothetical protein